MSNAPTPKPSYQEVKKYLIDTVQSEISANPPADDQFRTTVANLLKKVYAQTNLSLEKPAAEALLSEVFNDIAGYGPIQPYLDDPTITEIMVVGAKQIFIERSGTLLETDAQFDNERHLLRVINRIIHPLGRRVDSDSPAVDARLPDGSRVHAIIPPVAVDGACLTIRKFLKDMITMEELVQMGAITPHMTEFLEACVAARLNILISGGTSSGKTTMLNVLSNFIPLHERIVTIEDAVELKLMQKHIVRLETRLAGVDGKGEMDTRALVRNALRMRPDRIIVGEVRSGEAMDMLQAMNTGHTGSMTTLHANTPRDATSRLETMCLMSGIDMPLHAIRGQIASAINLIVHQARLEDGARKTTRITEVAGMEGEVVTLTDLFKYDRQGIDKDGNILGDLVSTGIRPQFSPRLEVVGFKLSGTVFGADSQKWSAPKRASRRGN